MKKKMKNLNKKIMILGASILQLPAIQKAKEMGLQVVVVDMNPAAIGFNEKQIEKEIISTIDIPKVMDAAIRHKIDGIMTLASDMPMRTVAAVAKEMGIVGINEDTAIKATNKACMREALKKNNVPVPKFYKVSNRTEYVFAVSKFDSAFIVKPADNSGSRGIVKVDDLSDHNFISNAYDYAKKSSRNGDVVVEEYMKGPEVSVETLTLNGECHVIQITDKITTGSPHFVEMGHTQPSRLRDDIKRKIADVAIRANKAVGITNGPSHTEIIVTKDGPKIVELGARLGGDCITTHLVPLSTGIDMVENSIKIALGEPIDIHAKYSKGSAIRYLSCPKGKIKSITGIEEARQMDGIRQVSIVHGMGSVVGEIESSTDRVGFIVAQGDTASDAAIKCEEACSKIKFSIED